MLRLKNKLLNILFNYPEPEPVVPPVLPPLPILVAQEPEPALLEQLRQPHKRAIIIMTTMTAAAINKYIVLRFIFGMQRKELINSFPEVVKIRLLCLDKFILLYAVI